MVESNQIYAPKTQLYLSGTQGLSAPASSTTIPDSDIRALIRPGAIPTSGEQAVVSRYDAASSSRDFSLSINTSKLRIVYWDSIQASTSLELNVDISTFLSTSALTWIRVKKGSGGGADFYYKAELDNEWTYLGNVPGTYRVPFSNSANLTIGGDQNAASVRPFIGNIAKVEIVSVADGSLITEADFSYPWTNNKYRDKTGKIWTINGSAWAWEYQDDPEDRYA